MGVSKATWIVQCPHYKTNKGEKLVKEITLGTGSNEKASEFISLGKLTAGAEIIGTYLGSYEGKYGLNYRIRNEAGDVVVVNGNIALLDKKMALVEPNTQIKIVYNGKDELEDGRSAHNVAVFADDSFNFAAGS